MSRSIQITLAVILAALVSLWFGGACDEGDGDGDADADSDADSDTDGDADEDGDTPTDADEDGDAPTDADDDTGDGDVDGDVVRLTCDEAVACIDACDTDAICVRDCGLAVCGPAGTKLAALLECSGTDCGGPCTDPESTACTECIDENCSIELLLCHTASCTAGERSCGEVMVCLEGCGTDETACTACTDSVCSNGSAELTTLLTCVEGSCSADCDDYGSAGCETCIETNCATQAGACVIDPCEV